MTTLPTVDTLARTLWGEARGCGADAMAHIANVVLNRAAHPRWWGDDVIHVCRAPYQFSCWNVNDPNHPKVLAVTTADHEFAQAVSVALRAVNGDLHDATGGADSYYAKSMRTPPYWITRATPTLNDGWHIFLRVELPAPDGGPDAPTVSTHVDEADVLDDEFNS